MTKFGFLTQRRPFVKAISGLANFDLDKVQQVATAAVDTGVQAIDVAADPTIIRHVKDHTDLVVFASALDAETLLQAAAAGADVLELGNFDVLYAKGETITAETVLAETRQILTHRPEGVRLCVTLPGRLSQDEQVDLATTLQAMGVDMLQVEVLADNRIECFHIAEHLLAIVELPIILAGGITLDNVRDYVDTGVQGLGIGRCISTLQSVTAMTETLRALRLTITEAAAGVITVG